jgi:hypothetical protein
MIERFTSENCKDAIIELVIENPKLPSLTKSDWRILDSLLNVLRPIKKETLKAQERGCSIASIIPSFKIIENELLNSPRTTEFPQVRREIVEGIRRRLGSFIIYNNI